MSAINRQPNKTNNSSNIKSLAIVGGVIAIGAVLLFAYLMWYVAPEENLESIKIVAVTESGCIGETYDGYAVNIGACDASPGEWVTAYVDQKVKERAALMNPTS